MSVLFTQPTVGFTKQLPHRTRKANSKGRINDRRGGGSKVPFSAMTDTSRRRQSQNRHSMTTFLMHPCKILKNVSHATRHVPAMTDGDERLACGI